MPTRINIKMIFVCNMYVYPSFISVKMLFLIKINMSRDTHTINKIG